MFNFKNLEEERAASPDIREEKDRDNFPPNTSPIKPDGQAEDDELLRIKSEKKWKEKRGGVIEIGDPNSKNYEEKLAEQIDSGEIAKNEKDEIGEASAPPRYPDEIRNIKRRFSLPGEKWEKLTQKEKLERKRKIQKAIEDLYIRKNGKKKSFLGRKDKPA